MPKLNIGCGRDYKEGWTNIDSDKSVFADGYFDLEERWGLTDNLYDEVKLSHVIEHIHREKIQHFFRELHRVCKDGARIKMYAPHFSCGITYRTLSHLTPITYFSFDHIKGFKVIKKKLNFFREGHPYKERRIGNLLKKGNFFFSLIPNLIPLFYERFLCWIYPVEEVEMVLEVGK